jgi:hypothetical protein
MFDCDFPFDSVRSESSSEEREAAVTDPIPVTEIDPAEFD